MLSLLRVLVAAAPPWPRLVASPGCAVEPLVHTPESVQSARIGGVGVVDDAVLQCERTHARPLARIGGQIGSGHGREAGGSSLRGFRLYVQSLAAGLVIVFDGPGALLLLGDRDVEVKIEIAAV